MGWDKYTSHSTHIDSKLARCCEKLGAKKATAKPVFGFYKPLKSRRTTRTRYFGIPLEVKWGASISPNGDVHGTAWAAYLNHEIGLGALGQPAKDYAMLRREVRQIVAMILRAIRANPEVAAIRRAEIERRALATGTKQPTKERAATRRI